MARQSMMPPWPRALVFDLDGTLVDSAPDIQRALNEAFQPLGVAPFGLDQVKGLIGGGAPAAIARAARMADRQLTAAEEAEALARFYPVYAEASAEGRGLYPGAIELLEHLTGRGLPLGLCTNKAQHITEIALGALGIRRYFTAVVGARDDLPKKPDPAMLLRAMAPLGADPAASVMIGDTAADIGAARAAGCRSIAISHGYSRIPSEELGADAIVSGLAEVPAALSGLAPATS